MFSRFKCQNEINILMKEYPIIFAQFMGKFKCFLFLKCQNEIKERSVSIWLRISKNK